MSLMSVSLFFGVMNELPAVIRSLFIRNGFWGRQGANIASRCKKMYGGILFRILFCLSEIDLGNVDTDHD